MCKKPSYDDLKQRIYQLEQKQAEHEIGNKQLLESEERFKALHDASFGGVIIHDQGLILDCNQGLSDMTGFSNEELVGMNGLELIAPESLAQVLKNIKSGYTKRYEVEGVRKDGSVYPLAIKGKNIPYKGQEARVIEFQDFSERKLAEEEKSKLEIRLQKAQRMEAIGTLAGGIAHDFNNILAVILGYADLAKDDAPIESNFGKDIDQILVAASRARELVKQILDFSRQTEAVRKPLQIQPIVEESLKLLRSTIPSTISITRDIDKKCGTVLADSAQVHQIFMNLFTNAFHAMEKNGGELSVKICQTSIDPGGDEMNFNLLPGNYVEFSVSDSGVGIKSDLKEKIFEPYFTTKDIGKGTGMGLAIIHGIMKTYGGAIVVESQFGEGATFRVFFPLVENIASVERVKPQNIPRGTERILLVDDEELLCEMGKEILDRLGYQVTALCNSRDALALFKQAPDAFDLVITDQTMPVLTGYDLAGHLLKIRPTIPIILCTGFSNLVDARSAKALGIKEFAIKPLTQEVLGGLVRKALDD